MIDNKKVRTSTKTVSMDTDKDVEEENVSFLTDVQKHNNHNIIYLHFLQSFHMEPQAHQ